MKPEVILWLQPSGCSGRGPSLEQQDSILRLTHLSVKFCSKTHTSDVYNFNFSWAQFDHIYNYRHHTMGKFVFRQEDITFNNFVNNFQYYSTRPIAQIPNKIIYVGYSLIGIFTVQHGSAYTAVRSTSQSNGESKIFGGQNSQTPETIDKKIWHADYVSDDSPHA